MSLEGYSDEEVANMAQELSLSYRSVDGEFDKNFRLCTYRKGHKKAPNIGQCFGLTGTSDTCSSTANNQFCCPFHCIYHYKRLKAKSICCSTCTYRIGHFLQQRAATVSSTAAADDLPAPPDVQSMQFGVPEVEPMQFGDDDHYYYHQDDGGLPGITEDVAQLSLGDDIGGTATDDTIIGMCAAMLIDDRDRRVRKLLHHETPDGGSLDIYFMPILVAKSSARDSGIEINTTDAFRAHLATGQVDDFKFSDVGGVVIRKVTKANSSFEMFMCSCDATRQAAALCTIEQAFMSSKSESGTY